MKTKAKTFHFKCNRLSDRIIRRSTEKENKKSGTELSESPQQSIE